MPRVFEYLDSATLYVDLERYEIPRTHLDSLAILGKLSRSTMTLLFSRTDHLNGHYRSTLFIHGIVLRSTATFLAYPMLSATSVGYY